MIKDKLISFSFQTVNNLTIIITVLKERMHYFIRVEYMDKQNKLKETNIEIPKSVVCHLFTNLEEIDFEKLDEEVDGRCYCLKVYYGKRDCIKRYLNKDDLMKQEGLNKVVIDLLEYLDDESIIDELKL